MKKNNVDVVEMKMALKNFTEETDKVLKEQLQKIKEHMKALDTDAETTIKEIEAAQAWLAELKFMKANDTKRVAALEAILNVKIETEGTQKSILD